MRENDYSFPNCAFAQLVSSVLLDRTSFWATKSTRLNNWRPTAVKRLTSKNRESVRLKTVAEVVHSRQAQNNRMEVELEPSSWMCSEVPSYLLVASSSFPDSTSASTSSVDVSLDLPSTYPLPSVRASTLPLKESSPLETSKTPSFKIKHGGVLYGDKGAELERSDILLLDDLRNDLMRQEETVIFSLIERAQFALNTIIYLPNALDVSQNEGSFLDYYLLETEQVHSKIRRYTSPDEVAYFPDQLPPPILPLLDFPQIIRPNKININSKIMNAYIGEILPSICPPGDDKQYGSTAICDVTCLQALSKRIHYGKFVAEAKFREDPAMYARLIQAGDIDGIMATLTNAKVEERLLRRVHYKAFMYGRDVEVEEDTVSALGSKVDPEVVVDIYRRLIIPLTKDVEVEYLLQRLDPPFPSCQLSNSTSASL